MASPYGSNTSLWSARLGDAKRRCACPETPASKACSKFPETLPHNHWVTGKTPTHSVTCEQANGPKSDELNLELYLTGDAVLAEIFCHDPNWSHRILDQIE